MADKLDRLRKSLDEAGLTSYADEILKLKMNTIGITAIPTGGDGLLVGASKIGGLPDLPSGWEWPYYEHELRENVHYHHSTREPMDRKPYTRSPLSFIAQLNMSEVKDHDLDRMLPGDGILYFFYDAADQPWDAGGLVLYYDGDISLLQETAPPEELCFHGRFDALGLSFSHYPSLPCFTLIGESVHIENLGLAREDEEKLGEVLLRANLTWRPSDDNSVGGAGHQMLGYPIRMQGDPFCSCERTANPGVPMYLQDAVTYQDILDGLRMNPEFLANALDWRLLLQVDSIARSGTETGMMWGDLGLLYFCMREKDLAARDFSKIRMTLQCG